MTDAEFLADLRARSYRAGVFVFITTTEWSRLDDLSEATRKFYNVPGKGDTWGISPSELRAALLVAE